MKIGVLFCSYGLPQSYNEKSLYPWRTRESVVISAVSTSFKNFPYVEDNKTKLFLRDKVDFLFDSVDPINEWDARNIALSPLLEENCDIIIPVDGDEFWTESQIDNVIDFVTANPLICWFKVAFKNFVFNKKTYLSDPFWGNRVFRTKHDNLLLSNFYYDCELKYKLNGKLIDFKAIPNTNIPRVDFVWVDHYAWLDEEPEEKERSLAKCSYQEMRKWPSKSRSYIYTDKLKFNPEFEEYQSKGFPVTSTL